MKLYKTPRGPLVENDADRFFALDAHWDDLVAAPGLRARLLQLIDGRAPTGAAPPTEADCLAPVGSQEVWAAGVTYFRSRDARMEESKDAGGRRLLRPGLRSGAAGAVLQGQPPPRPWSGPAAAHPP